jgi:hypothetical protein
MEDADKSLDAERVYIPIHRYYLSTEICELTNKLQDDTV